MARSIRGPIVAILAVGFALVVGSRIALTMWLRRCVSESVSQQIVPVLWWGFLVELLVWGGIFLVMRWLVVRDLRERSEQARVVHLADVAALSTGFAHEARNLLHAMSARIDLLRKTVAGNEKGLGRLQKLDELAHDLQHLFTDFLTFARPAQDHLEETDITTLVEQVLGFEQLELERLGIAVSCHAEANVSRVLVDRGKLKRALLNLIVNARQAMPDGGKLELRVSSQKKRVRIDVHDTGEGISQHDQSRVFETYFTTKAEGTGLGLAITRRTIEDLRGRIQVESSPHGGTTFTIFLPSVAQHRANMKRRAQRLAIDDLPMEKP